MSAINYLINQIKNLNNNKNNLNMKNHYKTN